MFLRFLSMTQKRMHRIFQIQRNISPKRKTLTNQSYCSYHEAQYKVAQSTESTTTQVKTDKIYNHPSFLPHYLFSELLFNRFRSAAWRRREQEVASLRPALQSTNRHNCTYNWVSRQKLELGRFYGQTSA